VATGPAAEDGAQAGLVEGKPSEEPDFIEVWRSAGRSERRPHRPRRRQHPQQTQVSVSGSDVAARAPPAEVDAAASASPEAASPSRGPRPRHDRGDRPEREKRQDRHERQQRMERQGERPERQDRGPRRERPRRDRGERVDRAEREQYYAKPLGSNSGGRDKQPDPNSPFAKLAALKQQLEQSGKEPS
jgi:ATP-dependent RNA helicase SUPV3L1/SUV3